MLRAFAEYLPSLNDWKVFLVFNYRDFQLATGRDLSLSRVDCESFVVLVDVKVS
jgi:hypothetical protein